MRSGIQESFKTLRWTESQWDDGTGVPSTENKKWNELTCDEKKAADFVCFFQQNWDKESLTVWGGIAEPASPSCGGGGGGDIIGEFVGGGGTSTGAPVVGGGGTVAGGKGGASPSPRTLSST